MNRKGRVLIVENEQRWRDALTDILQQDGFQAEAVGTTAQAWECLETNFYHLATFDIRMEDQFDPTDVEGIKLLRRLSDDGLNEAMRIVLLSAYGTKNQMREAFKKHGISDFLSKDEFDDREFLKELRQIFTDQARINLNLAIHWQQVSGPEEVVLNLKIDGTRIKYKSPMRPRLAEELDDLLCRLFHRADSLLVRPLTSGFSGLAVLLVTPSSTGAGAGQPAVVKLGDVRSIDSEYQRFRDYVQHFIAGGRTTNVIERRRSTHLGGIVYSLLGTVGNRLESFGDFYKRVEAPQIRKVLDNLFLETCAQWYANPGRVILHDLTAEYLQNLDLTPEGLEQDRINLKSAQGKESLRMSGLAGERYFTNPVLAMTTRSIVEPTYVCLTHGDLSESNVLIDETEHTWLIDFGRTGHGHILRDVAILDTTVRIQLLGEGEATLDERLKMEEALCGAAQFSDLFGLADSFETENRALAKAFATAIHLRTLAHKLVERNPNASVREYYAALFYYALGYIKYYALPKAQREHALLSASLLADRLGLGVKP